MDNASVAALIARRRGPELSYRSVAQYLVRWDMGPVEAPCGQPRPRRRV